MAQLFVIETLVDTITSERSKSTNYVKRKSLTLRNGAGFRLFAYIQARGLPIRAPGARVVAADLYMVPTASFPTTTFHLRRPLKAWNSSTLRWSNQPDPGPVNARSKSGTRHRPIAFDITDFMSAWIEGSLPNNGLRLEVSNAAAISRDFFSMNAQAELAPWIELIISVPPDAPTEIQPASGEVSVSDPLVTWRYGGEFADEMAAYQVQTSNSNVWASPASDTGWVAATQPRHRLTGVTEDGTWFRIRHRAADGREGPWSQGQRVSYLPRPVVTITSTEATTDDPTPSITWTVTGGVQTAFQAILRGPTTIVSGRRVTPVRDSGLVIGDDLSWDPSEPLPLGQDWTREVRSWFDDERVPTIGEPVYSSDTTGPFQVVPAGGVAVPANVTVTTPFGPVVDVNWELAQTPDEVIVERRMRRAISDPWGEWKAHFIDIGDVALGDGQYRWRDVTAPAEHELAYRVRAVRNRSVSDASSIAETRLGAGYIWLLDPDDTTWLLPMASDDDDMEIGEESAVHVVPGADRVHVVHEGYRGYEGTISGEFFERLPDGLDISAQAQRDKVWHILQQPTHVWRLAISDMNIPVVLRGVTTHPQAGAELEYGVKAEFYQQGELAWSEQ